MAKTYNINQPRYIRKAENISSYSLTMNIENIPQSWKYRGHVHFYLVAVQICQDLLDILYEIAVLGL